MQSGGNADVMDERHGSSDSQTELSSSHICSREILHKPCSESHDIGQVVLLWKSCNVGDLTTEELSRTNICELDLGSLPF